MLTRLKVSGFKNLVDIDVYFGPFTCIAGANGVGKSNLFDAIQFLSALADKPLMEAAQSIRGKHSHIRDLFHHVGENYDSQMFFEVEMIIPKTGEDDLGQTVRASSTFLTYRLVLELQAEVSLSIVEERLTRRTHQQTFPYSPIWFDSVYVDHATDDFIQTQSHEILLYAEPQPYIRRMETAKLPRTVLSSVNSGDYPTTLLARREMQSWRLFHLETSALRRPDEKLLGRLSSSGEHLPSTIDQLTRQNIPNQTPAEIQGRIFSGISNRLAQFMGGVRHIGIEYDNLQRLTIYLRQLNQTKLPMSALSDGALRVLGLATLAFDERITDVICVEEPENGIHPSRLANLLDLLRYMTVSVDYAVDTDNPMRQVMINTHSPRLIQLVESDELVIAETYSSMHLVEFKAITDTWRSQNGMQSMVKQRLFHELDLPLAEPIS